MMKGLTEAEAARRLALHGANVLASAKPKSFFQTAFEILREPMFLLLLACGFLYVLLGDPADAAILSLAMAVVIGITIVQQQRTEKTLEALRDLSSPRALVIRDGTRRRIAGRDVVPGDLVVIGEGDRVPADGFVIEAKSLKVDESALTGESVAVLKCALDHAQVTPPAESSRRAWDSPVPTLLNRGPGGQDDLFA
jgi:Ca2+-transporting ATPase